MNLTKRSVHGFESMDLEVEMTEFPFDPGEEFHVQLRPLEDIKYFGITGNPEKDQTLSFKVGDAYVWVKWDHRLLPLLEEAIEKYKRGWSHHYHSCKEKVNENG